MKIFGSAKQLTIYIGESDQWEHRPLYQVLLETLKREGLAGATVLHGVAGFGAHSRIHTTSLLRLSTDLPIVISVIDTPQNIERVLPIVGPMVREGLITLEDVEIIKYTHRLLPELPHEISVKEVMSTDVARVQPNTPLSQIMALLLERRVKAVPVVDDENRVVGIITGGDLLERANVGLRLSLQQHLTPKELAERLQRLANSGQVASDIMTRTPICISADASLAEAGRLMVTHGVKRLPVVDSAGRLVGIISRFDILRTIAGGIRVGASMPVEKSFLSAAPHTAGDLAIREVPTVQPDTPLETVLEQIITSPLRRVVVTDAAGHVVGLINDQMLLNQATPEARPGLLQTLAARLWSHEKKPAAQPAQRAGDVMVTEVFSVPENAPLGTILNEMIQRHVKRLVVVDAENHLIGLVDRQALLEALLGTASSNADTET